MSGGQHPTAARLGLPTGSDPVLDAYGIGYKQGHDEAVGSVLREVLQERERQAQKGYTPDHDRQHGLLHLLGLIRLRAALATDAGLDVPDTRRQLIEIAALACAAVEWIDG